MSSARRLSSDERDAVARAIHESYLATARANGETAETNPSLVAWDDLPESLRESNRAQAEDIPEKLSLIGCEAVPASDAPELFAFTPAEVDRLAREEHDRWWRDRERDGWEKGPVKHTQRKQSPDLVPWDQLSEAVRQLDRDAVLAIPQVLASARLAVRRNAGEGAS